MSDGPSVHHFGWQTSTAPWIVDVATINGLASTPYRTWAFRRAEITAFVGSPFRLPNGNPVTFARVRQLDPRLTGAERFGALAQAVRDGLQGTLDRVPRDARLAIVICLPERMEGDRASERDRRARRRVESVLAGPLIEQGREVDVRVIARGHASYAFALAECGELMQRHRLEVGLLVGIDSYYDPFVLEALFDEQRILDTDWRDAFVPGEAATAMLLARPDVARALGMRCLAELESVATGKEVATTENDVGVLGLGLSRPAVAVCQKMKENGARLHWWISDATGESFRVQELQLAWPRAARLVMTPEDRLELLPTHLGDIGAASIPTSLAIGIEGLRRGDPKGRYCLATGSSNGGARGVVLVGASAA